MSYTPLPPDSRPLLDRVRDIWKKDLNILPVYKDLPRLAGGFEIVDGNTKRMIYKETPGENRATTCKDIIWTIAAYFPDSSDKDEVEKLRLAKLKEREKAKSGRTTLGDTHDEREIFEFDDDDDDDDFVPPLRSSGEAEMELDQEMHGEDSSEEYLEQAEAHYIANRAPSLIIGKPTKNLFANKIAAKYSQFVRGGDISVQLQKFLASGAIEPLGKLSGILKCIQQEIICPPVMDLRMGIYSTLPYKDVKGTWYVRIELYFVEEEEEKKEEELAAAYYSKSPHNNEPIPIVNRSKSGTNEIKRGVFVHTPPTKRKLSHKPNLLLSSHNTTEDGKEEEKPSSPSKGIAGARRFLKRTHSLPVFEGSLPTKSIRDNLTKSKLSTPPPKLYKESEGKKKMKESSPLIERGRKRKKPKEKCDDQMPPLIQSGSVASISRLDTDEEEEIEYRPIQRVRVLHRKREQCHDDDPSVHVEFEWELALTFDAEVDCVQDATLRLTDVFTGDCVTKERKEQLFNIFKPYTSKEFPFANIWKRPCSKLLTLKYIQQSARISTVIDSTGKSLFEPSRGKTSAFYFLHSIASCVENMAPSCMNSQEQKLLVTNCNSHATDGSLHKAAKALITSYSNLQIEEGALGRLLKAVCKEITVPASSQIKNLLIPLSKEIKAIKGSRAGIVQFYDHTVCVSHYQRYTCTLLEGNSSDRFFVFEWKLSLTFNRQIVQLLSVSLELVEYSFSVNVSPTTRKSVLATLTSWITSETVESSQRSIPVDTAIRCLSTALSKLPNGKEIVTDPSLPGGKMSAVSLLELLHEALVIEGLPSIPCAEIKQGGTC